MDMKLTAKQEAFCLSYIETGNASEAYRQAYNTSRMRPETVNERSSRMLKEYKISTRLEELRAPVRERAMLTLESHLERLDELSRAAEEQGQYAPAITAETNRGKAAGLYTEKHEHTGPDGGPVQVVIMTPEEIKRVMQSDDC